MGVVQFVYIITLELLMIVSIEPIQWWISVIDE